MRDVETQEENEDEETQTVVNTVCERKKKLDNWKKVKHREREREKENLVCTKVRRIGERKSGNKKKKEKPKKQVQGCKCALLCHGVSSSFL